MRYVSILFLCLVFTTSSFATVYYVSLSGNDGNDGSSGRPWRTLSHAATRVPANQGHTIQVAAGTFVENQIFLPEGVHLLGAGRDATIIKSNPSFYYYPAYPGVTNDKYLIRLYSGGSTNGNQSVKNLTIDGDGKKLHGGIFVHNRSNVLIENIKIQYVNFNAILFNSSNNGTIRNIVLKDCAWGSSSWCSAALHFGNSTNLDISQFDIDEGRGYGIKNMGHDQNAPLNNVKLHHGKVSVHQVGLWAGGSAPNIAIELWAGSFPGTEIYNTYVDNHISIVNPTNNTSGTPLRLYNNVFDILSPRTRGAGYCLELSANDVEIRNNWFNGGTNGIVNWTQRTFSNWNIHHNVFSGIAAGGNSTAIVTCYKGGITNLNLHNNTVEVNPSSSVAFLELDQSSRGTNLHVKNNLLISTGANSKAINLKNGASISNLNVTNNFFQNYTQGTVAGNYASNTTGTASILRSGNKPQTFYNHVPGGNLIDRGTNVGYESNPDMGACGDNNLIGTAGVASPPPTNTVISVTGVSISPSSLTIGINGNSTLTRNILPSNATNQNVTWSSSNNGIARVDAASGVVTGVAAGTVTITVATADGNKRATSSVTVNASTPPTTGGSGVLNRAIWNGVSGDYLSALKSNSAYPNSPSTTGTVSTFSTPAGADNYGSRIYGYIRPQATGSYTFWIAGDNNCELYLSSDQNASNKSLIASVADWTNPGELTKYAAQKSVVKTLTAGQYYYVEALHKEGAGGDFLSVYWQGPGISQSIIGSAYLSTSTSSSAPSTPTPAPTPPAPGGGVNGVLTRAVWNGPSGDLLATLKSQASFPNSPSSTSTVSSFKGPSNSGDNYGSRIYGYLRPQTSGSYTFWIAGDNNSELYLSTDQNAANKTLIASLLTFSAEGELNKFPTQQSVVKNLTAGQYYYIEALHKEGAGGDFVSVYWQGPGIAQSIIGSAYISTSPNSGGGGASPDGESAVLTEEGPSEQLRVYPVPIERGADFMVELPSESREVKMIDVNGRQHLSVPASTEKRMIISSQGLVSGIYYLQVIHSKGAAFKKVMVK